MLVRRASALLLSFQGPTIEARNFIARTRIECTWLSVQLLTLAADWVTPDQLRQWYGVHEQGWVEHEIARLVDSGCLVAAGTMLAGRDAKYASNWPWAADAALYHFSMKDPTYADPDFVNAAVAEKLSIAADVPLYQTNAGYEPVTALPDPDCSAGVLGVMRGRRSERAFAPDPMSLQALGDCLFAGLGITGFLDIPIPGHPPLPLKMTPSGGARNPYEGYVYARNVSGLPVGLYHYSALENSLGRLATWPLPSPGMMLAGQHWADAAGAIVFLIANFGRTAWKYEHPTGYRVVLVEAGHIAQNLLLSATQSGMTGVPTTAVADSLVEFALGIDGGVADVVYAIALGPRTPADLEPPPDVRGFVRDVR